MDCEFVVALWSSPAVAAVPEAQRPGILRIVGAQITWRSTAAAATLAPISLAPASVFKLQKSPDTKPDVKLRLVMGDEKGAPAYVFEFLGSSARANRDVLIEHHRVCTAPDAVSLSNAVPNPSPSPDPSAAPTKSASPVVGNVEERLAAGGSAIRKGANIGSNPLAGIEDPMILKERALASSSALRSQYQSLVNENGGIISDAAFWEGHRADLVRVALSKPKIGLPSQVPDDLRAKDGGVKRLTMDRATMLSVFARDPAIREAFGALVPLKMGPKEFWTMYYKADESKRRRRPEGASATASVAAAAAAAAAPVSNRDAMLSAIRAMGAPDFFEAYRRGDFDSLYVAARASSGSAALTLATSSRGGDGRGLDGDLVSTIEDSTQAASLRQPDARSGYGNNESSRAYALSELEARSMNVRDEDIAKEESKRQEIIDLVNSHSRHVVDSTIDVGADGTSALTATSTAAASARSRAAAAEHSSSVSSYSSTVSSSTANDLTDLYADNGAAGGAALAPLRIDMQRFREALVAQGEGGEDASPAAAASASAAATGARSASSAANAAGPLSAGVGAGVGDRKRAWAVVSTTTDVTFSSTTAAGTAGGGGLDRGESAVKRRRIDIESSGVISVGDVGDASNSGAVAAAPPPPPPHEVFSRPAIAAAKSLIRDLTRSAHDLFAAGDRSKTGFSKAVPAPWRSFVEARFRSINEVLSYVWSMLRGRGSVGTTAAAAPCSMATIRKDRRDKLLQRLHVEFDSLEGIKKAVMQRGAGALLPPLEHSGGRARDVEVQLIEDDTAATSELVSLLLLLQETMEPTLAAAEGGS